MDRSVITEVFYVPYFMLIESRVSMDITMGITYHSTIAICCTDFIMDT